MNYWLEVKDGYVRKDAIVEVYIDHFIPEDLWLILQGGQSILYKNFDSAEEASQAAQDLVYKLNRYFSWSEDNTYTKLP